MSFGFSASDVVALRQEIAKLIRALSPDTSKSRRPKDTLARRLLGLDSGLETIQDSVSLLGSSRHYQRFSKLISEIATQLALIQEKFNAFDSKDDTRIRRNLRIQTI